jgi:glycosyltransferase 2 family protein
LSLGPELEYGYTRVENDASVRRKGPSGPSSTRSPALNSKVSTIAADRPVQKTGTRWGVFAFRAALTIGIFVFLFSRLDAGSLLATMKKTGLGLWLLMVVVHILAHVVVVAKWRLLMRAAGSETRMTDALRAHGAGVFANLYLPSIVGGDVIRAGIISPGGRNLAATITGGVADRITDSAALVILAAVGLILVPATQSGTDLRILLVVSAGLIAVVFGGILTIRMVNPDRFPPRIARILHKVRKPIETMFSRKGATLTALLMALGIQSFFVLQNMMIGNAIGIQVPAAAWFVAWPLAKLAALVPFSLGGLGVREAMLAALFSPFSVPATLAVASSLVWQTVMYALGLFGGVSSLCMGYFHGRGQQEVAHSDA